MSKSPIEKLTMMANQIAQFFKSYPHDEAVAGIASHIEAFWTPKMIATLQGRAWPIHGDVDPLVMEAMSPEVAARDPAEKADAGPGKVGELGRGRRGVILPRETGERGTTRRVVEGAPAIARFFKDSRQRPPPAVRADASRDADVTGHAPRRHRHALSPPASRRAVHSGFLLRRRELASDRRSRTRPSRPGGARSGARPVAGGAKHQDPPLCAARSSMKTAGATPLIRSSRVGRRPLHRLRRSPSERVRICAYDPSRSSQPCACARTLSGAVPP